jgi:hypothetical protein
MLAQRLFTRRVLPRTDEHRPLAVGVEVHPGGEAQDVHQIAIAVADLALVEGTTAAVEEGPVARPQCIEQFTPRILRDSRIVVPHGSPPRLSST